MNCKPLSFEQLSKNLSILLATVASFVSPELSYETLQANPEYLIYRRIEHVFETDTGNMWYKGTVMCRTMWTVENTQLCMKMKKHSVSRCWKI